MNEIIGSLAQSLKGRDSGNVYLIYSATNTQVWLVDGDARKIKNPKKKNLKHIKLLNAKSESIKQKITENLKVFDSEIYSFIKNFKK
ncbi:MAG: hypothetical protein E7359_02630 [Clostridiales bacterium]|nr:hypothetical protein [Clostridiales bacterium]